MHDTSLYVKGMFFIYLYNFLMMGGNCPGGNCPRWELSAMGIVRDGWEFPRWELSAMGIVLDGNCPRWELSGWELS